MKIGYRGLLATTLTVAALISWGILSARQTVEAEPMDQLARANVCATSAYHLMAGANATMAIANDGGWCWSDTYEKSYWRILSADSVTVVSPPKHGRVVVSDIANHEVRVAYRPIPGFTGTDNFIVHYQANAHDQSYLVTVSRPMSDAPGFANTALNAGQVEPGDPRTPGAARDTWMSLRSSPWQPARW